MLLMLEHFSSTAHVATHKENKVGRWLSFIFMPSFLHAVYGQLPIKCRSKANGFLD